MPEVIEVGLEIKGAKKAEKSIDGISDATDNLGSSTEAATGALDKMTGGAVSAFKSFGAGIKNGVKGLRTFKGALAATGIGLIVVAVGSLVTWFTKTKKGAEVLEIATAALGAAFSIVIDTVSGLGEGIFNAFNDPKAAVTGLWDTIKTYFIDKFNKVIESVGLLGSAFKKLFEGDFSGALDDASEGAKGLFMELTPVGMAIEAVGYVVEEVVPKIKEFADEIVTATKAATALANRSIALREAQRTLDVAFAEGRAQIREYQLISEDTTKTIEERIEASEQAAQIEADLVKERQRIAQEKLDIHNAEMALSESLEEDYDKRAQLEVELIQIREETARIQKAIQAKTQALRNEEQANLDAIAAADEARRQKDSADKKKAHEEDLKLLEEKLLEEKAAAEATRAARLSVVAAGFDALKSMAKTEEGQKKIAIAQILVNQGIALSNAIASAQTSALATGPGAVFTAPGFTASMIAMVLGSFAQIKGIMNQAGASSSGVGAGGGGSFGVAGEGGGVPRLGLVPNLAKNGVGADMPPVQAYVIQNDIADAGALASEIQARSSL